MIHPNLLTRQGAKVALSRVIEAAHDSPSGTWAVLFLAAELLQTLVDKEPR